MSVKNLKNLIHPVCNAAIQAGKIINKYEFNLLYLVGSFNSFYLCNSYIDPLL